MQQLADLSSLVRELEALRLELEALRRENKILREHNALLQSHAFGRKTERLAPGQLAFAENGEPPQPAPEPSREPAKDAIKAPAKGHGRAPFPESMPREVIAVPVLRQPLETGPAIPWFAGYNPPGGRDAEEPLHRGPDHRDLESRRGRREGA